jgi:AIPR protein
MMGDETPTQHDHPLSEFIKDLNRDVGLRCSGKASPEQLERAFTEWALEELSAHNEVDNADVVREVAFEAASRGQWPAAKLNAWALSGDGATLDLVVSHFTRSGNVERLPPSEIRRQYRLLLGFLRRSLAGFHSHFPDEEEDAFRIAEAINASQGSLTTVRLFFITNHLAKADDIEQESIDGLELRYVLWDLQKFGQLRVGQREVVEIDFVETFGDALPCLEQPGGGEEFRTFLGFIPGPVLARLYGEHGQRLLERNVRAFLQKKGPVNKSIHFTLRDEPGRFLPYNNGLCCTAAEVRLTELPNGTKGLAWAKDFQIVNGGQTTASIYQAAKKERLVIDDVVVQLKLTVIKQPTHVNQLVPLIARYANSQNKVSVVDFAANGAFHQQLEKLSRAMWAPATDGLAKGTHWYYERARGSYLDDKARQQPPSRRKEWELENPARKKFTKTDLAKFEHAWLGYPHWVCLGAEKNFVKFAERLEDSEIEVKDDYFRHVVSRAILWRTAEKLFDALELEGYRANTVAYGLSWLAEKSGRRLDLERIWREQRLSAVMCECLKIACREAWHYLNAQGGNVGEASKKEETWTAFKRKGLTLPSGWEEELADNEFHSVSGSEDALAHRWDVLRKKFVSDSRTIEQLEVWTGKQWIKSRSKNPIREYAAMPWQKLRSQRGLGLTRIRALIEMLESETLPKK